MFAAPWRELWLGLNHSPHLTREVRPGEVAQCPYASVFSSVTQRLECYLVDQCSLRMHKTEFGTAVQACNPSTLEAKPGGPEVRGPPQLHKELEA